MRKYSDEQQATDASHHTSHLDAQMQVRKRQRERLHSCEYATIIIGTTRDTPTSGN